MIDWGTFAIDIGHLIPKFRDILDTKSDRVMRVSSGGEILWETSTWESLRSDMTGLAYSYGTELKLAGSPASVVNPNNVFGTSNVIEAFQSMVRFFEIHLGVTLPKNPALWSCSRLDVTVNYDLGGQVAVSQALEYLKHLTTRGNNVEKKHTTIYWNKSSALRSGKAYNKYLHAKHLTSKNKAFYTPEELELTKHILRLELKLGRQFFYKREGHWSQLTENLLQAEHDNFFKDVLINDIEVPTMDSLLNKLIEVSPTEGQARSAFDYYCRVMQMGSVSAKNSVPSRTYYRHLKNLKSAGLSTADLTAGQILQFRPQTINMNPVHSWDDLRAVG